MTNAEKFEEVFGIKPDIESMVIDCHKIPSMECKYWEDAGCHCEMWWREKYKEKSNDQLEKSNPDTARV